MINKKDANKMRKWSYIIVYTTIDCGLKYYKRLIFNKLIIFNLEIRKIISKIATEKE